MTEQQTKTSQALSRARDWARRMATTQEPLLLNPTSKAHGREWAYPTERERVIWQQIADEIDVFISDTQPIGGQLDLLAATEPNLNEPLP